MGSQRVGHDWATFTFFTTRAMWEALLLPRDFQKMPYWNVNCPKFFNLNKGWSLGWKRLKDPESFLSLSFMPLISLIALECVFFFPFLFLTTLVHTSFPSTQSPRELSQLNFPSLPPTPLHTSSFSSELISPKDSYTQYQVYFNKNNLKKINKIVVN